MSWRKWASNGVTVLSIAAAPTVAVWGKSVFDDAKRGHHFPIWGVLLVSISAGIPFLGTWLAKIIQHKHAIEQATRHVIEKLIEHLPHQLPGQPYPRYRATAFFPVEGGKKLTSKFRCNSTQAGVAKEASKATFDLGEGCAGMSLQDRIGWYHTVNPLEAFPGTPAEKERAWALQWEEAPFNIPTSPRRWSQYMRCVQSVWTIPLMMPEGQDWKVVAVISIDSTDPHAFTHVDQRLSPEAFRMIESPGFSEFPHREALALAFHELFHVARHEGKISVPTQGVRRPRS